MTPAERIYQALLLLYPVEHRRDYGAAMLQHVRDLSRRARQRGHLHLFALYLHLLIDGMVNATTERMEAIMTANGAIKPIPWTSVLLAAVPGLLLALGRLSADWLGPPLAILGWTYLALSASVLALQWWRRRQFPAWALLPAGMLVWRLTHWAGNALGPQLALPGLPNSPLIGTALVNSALAIMMFFILLRSQRVSTAAWALLGFILLGSVVGTMIYSAADGSERTTLFYLGWSLTLTAEGLMLVAVGLLAARQHGLLALLVVLGGYAYLCMDLDYLFGYRLRDWTGLPLYLITLTVLYLAITPITLLRAKTRLARGLAVFVPAAIFYTARLFIPWLMLGRTVTIRPGDIGISLIALLSLLLAWLLYGSSKPQTRQHTQNEPIPSPN